MWLLRRIGWWLYQLTMALGLLLAAPFLIARRGRHYLTTLRGRLGLSGAGSKLSDALWIHAVSVGEVAVAATLVGRLPKTLPLVITTVTPTGQERARALFAGRAEVAYLPFDFGFAVASFFRRYRPAALILVEGDYWPLVLEIARRRDLPVAVVNGRVGERSASRLRRIPRLARSLFFGGIRCFAVQTEQDRDRLIAAGAAAASIHVTGNLKFDSAAPATQPELETTVRELAAGRPILLAGSTMLGEDELLFDAFHQLGGGERALLLIAPRHPERFAAVARLAAERFASVLRRSRLGGGEAPPDVVVLDSLGELAGLYRVADIAFIGGTLVPTGGHNPLEPASFAVPIVVGPSMHNFREMAEIFDRAGAWGRAADARELADVWASWLADPAAAKKVGDKAAKLLAEGRGALDRTIALLEPLLPR